MTLIDQARRHFEPSARAFEGLPKTVPSAPEWTVLGDSIAVVGVSVQWDGISVPLTVSYGKNGTLVVDGLDDDASASIAGEATLGENGWSVETTVSRVPPAALSKCLTRFVGRIVCG
jgi:hypothetical protein